MTFGKKIRTTVPIVLVMPRLSRLARPLVSLSVNKVNTIAIVVIGLVDSPMVARDFWYNLMVQKSCVHQLSLVAYPSILLGLIHLRW